MKSRIVRIGNSQGVRIPKPLLEQSGLSDEVEIEAHEGTIIIRRATKRRRGWSAAFARMAEAGDDSSLDAEATLDEDFARKLDRAAERLGKTRSEVMREALRRHLAVMQFEQLRERVMPFAEAQGLLTDEDVERAVS
jgi:antitoxin MazE